MNGDSKYRLFRNFMVNELDVTRDDIERWTKEACAAQAEKIMANVDVEGIVTRVVRARVDYFIVDTHGGRNGLRDMVAAELAARIQLVVQNAPKGKE